MLLCPHFLLTVLLGFRGISNGNRRRLLQKRPISQHTEWLFVINKCKTRLKTHKKKEHFSLPQFSLNKKKINQSECAQKSPSMPNETMFRVTNTKEKKKYQFSQC